MKNKTTVFACALFILAILVACAPVSPQVSNLSLSSDPVNVNLPNALIGNDGLPVIEGVTSAGNCAHIFYIDVTKRLAAITYCPGSFTQNEE